MHPHVFKNQFSTYHGYAETAVKLGAIFAPITGGIAAQFASSTTPRQQGSSRWARAAWIGVGTAAVAAVGTATATAFMNKAEPVNNSYRWVSEHLVFVRNLWDTGAMSDRIDESIKWGIPFHCYYTRLVPPPSLTTEVAEPRGNTFVYLPAEDTRFAPYFSPVDSVRFRDLPACCRRDCRAYVHVPCRHQPVVLYHGPRYVALLTRLG